MCTYISSRIYTQIHTQTHSGDNTDAKLIWSISSWFCWTKHKSHRKSQVTGRKSERWERERHKRQKQIVCRSDRLPRCTHTHAAVRVSFSSCFFFCFAFICLLVNYKWMARRKYRLVHACIAYVRTLLNKYFRLKGLYYTYKLCAYILYLIRCWCGGDSHWICPVQSIAVHCIA